MAHGKGGLSAKYGNRYEYRIIIYQLLRLIEEEINYIIVEDLGDDERGVDLWIGHDGFKEGQQCKSRNVNKNNWSLSSLKSKGILEKWKFQLDRDSSNMVSLASPLQFTLLEDLIKKARNTSNAMKFFKYQIKSSKGMEEFFYGFCKGMHLDISDPTYIEKAIGYLNRIRFRQFPDYSLLDIINNKIKYLLLGDPGENFDSLLSYVTNEDILSKRINHIKLKNYLSKNKIFYRDLANDTRIIPRFNEINNLYKNSFRSLKNGFVRREIFNKCRSLIDQSYSIIVNGKAGVGKSGCLRDIINYCEENQIQYVAINLEKYPLQDNTKKWGEILGLSTSLSHCLHSISRGEKAVLILDQLDSIRWTNNNYGNALIVCKELLQEVSQLNKDRDFKISVVLSCRTYDLENDRGLKSVLNIENITFNSIKLNPFSKNEVKEIIGERAKTLSAKLINVLSVPSNLYIAENIEISKIDDDCDTTRKLMICWWNQIRGSAKEREISEQNLIDIKNKIIDHYNGKGRTYILKKLLLNSCSARPLNYLISSGMLIESDNRIQFAHQVISDYFIAENMLSQYYEDVGIHKLVGEIENQTPTKRYQVQMLFQDLLESGSQDFIEASYQLLELTNVRFSFKFIVFEILGQIEVVDNSIKTFILKGLDKDCMSKYLLKSVISSRPHYLKLLREEGVLDEWAKSNSKIEMLYRLFLSISPNYEKEDIDFIRKYFFSKESNLNLHRFFVDDISTDIVEMFELRMEYYEENINKYYVYINLEKILENNTSRLIKLVIFLLENNYSNEFVRIYSIKNLENKKIPFNSNVKEQIKTLLYLVPKEAEKVTSLSYDEWSARGNNFGLQRLLIWIIKEANKELIKKAPEDFWDVYRSYMGKGYHLFNEIILEAFYNLPKEFSSQIVKYFCTELNRKIFDYTSGNDDRLLLAKKVINKHSMFCSSEELLRLEHTIISYLSPDIKERYKKRITYKKYFSFWGELQKELLEALPTERTSQSSKELLEVLNRKFQSEVTHYKWPKISGGIVGLPIEGDKLSDNAWLKLITNKNLVKSKKSFHSLEGGKYIDKSVYGFAQSFSVVVNDDPLRMIKIVLGNASNVLDVFIDTLLNAVAYSNNLENVSFQVLKKLIVETEYNYDSNRAKHICEIIKKRSKENWPKEVIDIVKDIAINHSDPPLDSKSSNDNKEESNLEFKHLRSKDINCTRGNAAHTISKLIFQDKKLYEYLKPVVNILIEDKNLEVRLASLNILYSAYEFDNVFIGERILKLFESDIILGGYRYTIHLCFLLYELEKKRVLSIIENLFYSDDDDLSIVGAHSLAKMYIVYNEFEDKIERSEILTENQICGIMDIAIIYFDKKGYNARVKILINKLMSNQGKEKVSISRLFYEKKYVGIETKNSYLVL